MKLTNSFIKTVLFFALISGQYLFAQSNMMQLEWDPNSEADMYQYQIYKGTAPSPESIINTVNHPAVSYDDKQVEKGVLYYYRIKALDFSLNASVFSDQISVAIPKITNFPNSRELPADTTINLSLNEYVYDPDHADDLLNWAVTGNNLVQVSINASSHVATITTPAGWNSQEILNFISADPDNLSDAASFRITSSGTPQNAPQFSAVPEQQTNEDTQLQINLLDFVQDDDSQDSDLIFTAEAGANLQAQIDDSLLTLVPAANYFGSSGVQVSVTDETGLSDETWIDIRVLAVNDAPVILDLPQATLPQDSVIIISLTDRAQDIDNSDAELSWEFTNYYHLTLDYNNSSKEVTITSPADWSGFEYIQATVKDPSAASDTDTLLIRVTDISYPPQISSDFPDVQFPEDGASSVSLNDYVSDPNTPDEYLYWQAKGNEKISVEINHTNNSARFSAEQDWFGQEQLWMVVNDPEQAKDSIQITVTVASVNDAPKISGLPNIDLSENKQYTLYLNRFVSDVDDDTSQISWSFTGNQNVQVALNAGNVAQVSADQSWEGLEEIHFFAQDDEAGRDTSVISVYSQDQTKAPQITGIDTILIQEDGQRQIDLGQHVNDPDNSADQLSWSFSGNDHLQLQYNETSNLLDIIPEANWFGSEDIYLKVQDPDQRVDFDTLRVTVSSINDNPQISGIPGLITLIGSQVYTLDFKEYIIEPDGFSDIKSIELLGGEGSFIGTYLDLNNFQLTFFSPADYEGHETYLLRVTDYAGEQANAVFSVQVLRDNLANGILVSYFGGSQTDICMEWISQTETIDFIEYGLDKTYGMVSQEDADYSLVHEAYLYDLEENTSYHFRIVSQDENDRVCYSPDSVFTTGLSSEAINVFPIPFRSSVHSEGIHFTNLPKNGDVQIFTLAGEPVWRQTNATSRLWWNVKNKSGKKISSGLYLYVIKNSSNKKVTSGKLIIIN